MWSDKLFLGVDVGTTSVKAGLVDAGGNGLCQVSREYPSFYPSEGWAEQRAEDWWNAAAAAVRQLTAARPDLASRICCVCVSSQAPTLFGIDRQGNPVGNAMIWMDRRAQGICERELALHKAYIEAYSGNRLDPYYVLPKLLWQKENDPKTYRKVDQYLQINGWLVYRLTGRRTIDQTHAALTQMVNIYQMDWEEKAFGLFGLEMEKWPRICGCGEIVGEVLPAVAEAWGLPPSVLVVAGCIDGAAVPLGLGLRTAGDIFEMSGQSSGIGVLQAEPKFHPNLCSLKHALSGQWILKGSMSCSGGALKWFRDQVDRAGDYQEYDRLADSSVPGARGVTFLPYLNGERAPLWDTSLRGIYFGISTATDRADLVRAIMEGTGYALRTILEEFGTELEKKPILGTGGGYRSPVWTQIKADILNREICVYKMGFDAAVRGDAFLCMQALGLPIPWPELDAGSVCRPKAENRAVYDVGYELFQKIYRANRELFPLRLRGE